MNKQHLIAMAAVLRAQNADIELITAFADMAASFNPNFKRTLFLKAASQETK